MALAYSDLPVTTRTPLYATYQNFVRDALIERAAAIGVAITPPAVINAGDPIQSTLGPWISACRTAIGAILLDESYGWIPTLPDGSITFTPWDLYGDGPMDGNDMNGILHYIHTYLIEPDDNKYINDVYTVSAAPPIVGVVPLFCTENSDWGAGGIIGNLKADDANHVSFKARTGMSYGASVRIDLDDVVNVYDDTGTRFVRVRRTGAADLAGNGDITATVNDFDDHRWMYYDKGLLNPPYRGYFREIWFCIELMRYVEINYTPTATGGTSDGKSVFVDGYDTDTDAFAAAQAAFIALPWGAAPGGLYDTENRVLFGISTPGKWSALMYYNRAHNVTLANPGANILKIYLPFLKETSLLPPADQSDYWSGGTTVGEYTTVGNSKRSYLRVNVTVGVDLSVGDKYSADPSGGTFGWISDGSVSIKGSWDNAYRGSVKDVIYTNYQSDFFDDALNPPVVPPP